MPWVLFLNGKVGSVMGKQNRSKNGADSNIYELIPAEQSGTGVMPLLISVSYLGIFAGVVSIFMVLMSAMSEGKEGIDFTLLAGSIVVLALCIVLVIVFSLISYKGKEKFRNSHYDLIKNSDGCSGRIISVNRYVERILHKGSAYEQAMWSLNIEYTDKDGKTAVIESEKYLNDVTEVLCGSSVTVYLKNNGKFELDGFEIRQSEEDAKLIAPVKDIVTGEKEVYTF